MGINLMQDMGLDAHSKEVAQALEAVNAYEQLINSLVLSRKEVCLTQAELAKRMETSQSTISELENLSSDARFSTILRYAQAVGAEMEISFLTPRRAMNTTRPEWVSVHVDRESPAVTRVSSPSRGRWESRVKQFETKAVPLAGSRVAA